MDEPDGLAEQVDNEVFGGRTYKQYGYPEYKGSPVVTWGLIGASAFVVVAFVVWLLSWLL